MDKNYKFKTSLRLVLAVLFVGFVGSLSAQMSGTYTIDKTAATGGTNFASWADFRTAIVTNGVNGAVTVDVNTDITGSQVSFPAITGASSTNTITINGNGKFFAASVADAVILLDGADYFTFDNLIVRNTSTSVSLQGFRFMNSADYNTIKNCIIEFSALTTSSSTGGAYIGFSTSTSMTTTSSTNHGAFNVIDKNTMRTTNVNSPGPTFGIAIQGSTSTYTSTPQNNTISNNKIENFNSRAIRAYYTNGVQILNNDISKANATSYNTQSTLYGIDFEYSYASSRATKIEYNNTHDLPFLGATVSSAPTTIYAYYTYLDR